jgi:hypothetical protein
VSLQSIRTIEFEARASHGKIAEWGQHCANCRMPWLISIFRTFQRTGDHLKKNPSPLVRCTADIISNITDREIQRPGMLVDRTIGAPGLVGCTNNRHRHCSSRELILGILPPIACDHLAVSSATIRVGKAHWFKILVCLRLGICQKERYTFENITLV